MSMTVACITLLILILAGIGTLCRAHAESAATAPAAAQKQTGETHKTNRDALRVQLQQLATSEPPKTLAPGAMCYEMAMPPDRAEYTCPICGNKTLYASSPEERYPVPRFLEWDLPACRRLAGQIQTIPVTLDERSFCKQCTPEAETRQLCLVIDYGNGTRHIVKGVTKDDLQLLLEFSQGSAVHNTGPGGERPLKEYIKRLEELLGVKLNDE